ncbi:hypothetical protein ACJ41O_012338 [Fusarium nematophilum]
MSLRTSDESLLDPDDDDQASDPDQDGDEEGKLQDSEELEPYSGEITDTKKTSSDSSSAQASTLPMTGNKHVDEWEIQGHWDPTEEPIRLLGSVFDANSLGKWIYDWSVYRHGPATPISDMAGELWLLLIQLAGKIKRSEEVIGRVRLQEDRYMLEDFIESGERLFEMLRSLPKTCEAPMLKAAERKLPNLGNNTVVEFIDTLFGRDRALDRTEKFMQRIWIFNLRFDANCESIISHPEAD